MAARLVHHTKQKLRKYKWYKSGQKSKIHTLTDIDSVWSKSSYEITERNCVYRLQKWKQIVHMHKKNIQWVT